MSKDECIHAIINRAAFLLCVRMNDRLTVSLRNLITDECFHETSGIRIESLRGVERGGAQSNAPIDGVQPGVARI